MLFKIFDKLLIRKRVGSLSLFYRKLIFLVYSQALICACFNSFFCLIRGLFFIIIRNKSKSQKAFMEGSNIWSKKIMRLLNIEIIYLNKFNIPKNNHFIFINHVNEVDIPLDSLVVKQVFLANQTVKKMIIAYWWTKAMGSEIFDPSKPSTIIRSIRSILKSLKSRCYVVYPEGHNGYKESLQPLMRGIIKIAYDKKIPIYLLLKTGMTQFQKHDHDGKFQIFYKFIDIIEPKDYKTAKEFHQFVESTMNEEKIKLDNYFYQKIKKYEYTTKC